jgi:putative redox protein
MSAIDCATEQAGTYRARISVRAHEIHSDVAPATGGEDSGPGPHDLFDASLSACKVATAVWYAKKNGIPLERAECHIESDASEERAGKYKLSVRLAFHGPLLTDEQRQRLYTAVARCPIHKLMTTTDVVVETAPLAQP